MIRALYSAASGMTAQQLNVDNIAHNLANANTAGYKTRHAQFQDLMYQSVVQPGSAAGQQTVVPTGLQVGLGTRTSSNEILFTQGSFSQTDNPLDMVIQGKGFFQVRRPSGELAMPQTVLVWPARRSTILPESRSHNSTSRSSPADTRRRSPANATPST